MVKQTAQSQRLAEAIDAHRRGDLGAAEQGYRALLADDPTNAEARFNLGLLGVTVSNLASAMPLIEQALLDAPNADWLIAARRGIGLTLFGDGFWEAAAPHLAAVAAAIPSDGTVHDALLRCRPRADLPDIVDPSTGQQWRRYGPRESGSYQFIIDIVGSCNLRCPTCPVGNSPKAARARGFMAVTTFAAIVEKIRTENAHRPVSLDLYNWGEPLLHPELPALIGIAKAAGLPVNLSSNLNVEHGLEAMVKAGPTSLKISISGLSPETYGMTHARGDITLVKANMYRLRYLIDRYRSPLKIWVGHHLYRDNRHEQEAMAALCAELAFDYAPIEAFYMPAERLVDLAEGRPNQDDAGIRAALITDPVERMRRIADGRNQVWDCEHRFNQTVINHDGTVALCCLVYEPQNMLGLSYLQAEQAEIDAAKYSHEFCATCYRHNINHAPRDRLPGSAL